MRSQLFLTALTAAAVVAGCTRVDPTVELARQQQELARELDGRVAGKPLSCLPSFRNSGGRVLGIGDKLLFEDGGTIYVNQTTGGCQNAGRSGYIYVSELRGTTEQCRGDIGKVITSSGAFYAGSCGLGEFVPYSKPR
jgi:hypothetical protein